MDSITLTDVMVRALTADDATIYRTIRLRGLKEVPTAFSSSYEDESRRTPEEATALFRQRLSPLNQIFGAFSTTRLTGVVGIRAGEGLKTSHLAHLWGMYVEPESSRQGIGKRLITSAIQAARTFPSVTRIELTVESTNSSAIALYTSFGFKSWGRHPQSLKIAHHFYDEDHMTLLL